MRQLQVEFKRLYYANNYKYATHRFVNNPATETHMRFNVLCALGEEH